MCGLLKVSRYITYREGEEDAGYFILQKDYPHFVAEIKDMVNEGDWCTEQIDGYNLWVVFSGIINGRYVPSNYEYEEILAVMRDMSLWYLANRVSKNEKKYKKFKDDSFPNKSGNSNHTP